MNNIQPRNPILRIKYRFLEWQWDRVLRRNGYTDWKNYFRATDPDYDPAGRTVRDQLCGYPYVAPVPLCHLETVFEPFWGPVERCNHIVEWCEQNCSHRFRHHWERVIQDHRGQYLPNGIGGADRLFFGFKDERDYLMFTLRWG